MKKRDLKGILSSLLTPLFIILGAFLLVSLLLLAVGANPVLAFATQIPKHLQLGTSNF